MPMKFKHQFIHLGFLSLLRSFLEEQTTSSDMNSDVNSLSLLSSHTSDGLFTSSSDSSYNSDQGSGNEGSPSSSHAIQEESSDEVDYL